jgi:hypothetical protein
MPDRSSARCINWQKLRVQELLGADQQQQGKVPRSVEVRMRPDKLHCCNDPHQQFVMCLTVLAISCCTSSRVWAPELYQTSGIWPSACDAISTRIMMYIFLRLQVELKQDLVGSCVVGDVVTVLGLVKVLATGDAKPSGNTKM